MKILHFIIRAFILFLMLFFSYLMYNSIQNGNTHKNMYLYLLFIVLLFSILSLLKKR